MKEGIHPKFNNDTVVTCACGNSFVTSSTLEKITVEICSACHPFYTGQQKFVDTEGRIDKFKKKQKIATELKEKAKKTKQTKSEKIAKKKPSKQKTLKELLHEARSQSS